MAIRESKVSTRGSHEGGVSGTLQYEVEGFPEVGDKDIAQRKWQTGCIKQLNHRQTK